MLGTVLARSRVGLSFAALSPCGCRNESSICQVNGYAGMFVAFPQQRCCRNQPGQYFHGSGGKSSNGKDHTQQGASGRGGSRHGRYLRSRHHRGVDPRNYRGRYCDLDACRRRLARSRLARPRLARSRLARSRLARSRLARPRLARPGLLARPRLLGWSQLRLVRARVGVQLRAPQTARRRWRRPDHRSRRSPMNGYLPIEGGSFFFQAFGFSGIPQSRPRASPTAATLRHGAVARQNYALSCNRERRIASL